MLGTVQFGLNYGIANRTGKPPIEQVHEILTEAARSGINVLDTAAAYGESESVLGEVLIDLDLRDRFHIITKTPPMSPDLVNKDALAFIRSHLEESLRRLRQDRISVLLLHREDDLRYLPLMSKLIDEGYTGGIGVSLDSDRFLKEAEEAQYVQIPYNVLDRRFDSFLEKAHEHKTTVFARSPFLQGLLAMPIEEIPTHLSAVIPWRRIMEDLAKENEYDFKTFCIQFVLACPAITSLVFGVDRVDQLRENFRAFSAPPLSADLFAQAKEMIPLLEERLIRPAKWGK